MAADAYPHPLTDLLCQGENKDLHSYFEQSVQNLLKESSEKFKGWLSTPGPLNTELSCKKVNATVWRGPWCHTGKCVRDDCWEPRVLQAPADLLATLWCLFSYARRDQQPLPWPEWGAGRWTALGRRVLCAQQSWQRAHHGRGSHQ